MVERVLLIRYSEIHLKGLNRPFFERKLSDAIKAAVRGFGGSVTREQGRMYVWGVAEKDEISAISKLQKVFGIHSVSPALVTEKEWENIINVSADLLCITAKKTGFDTFKVFAKRSDKRFPMTSDTICRELGHELLNRCDTVHVDIHAPKIKISVEIREKAFIYTEEYACTGGMPSGSAGLATLLISGGIDSPVAGYMMAKRGLHLSAVHFYSYPYTSERARDKVVALTQMLSSYAGPIRLHLVPFTEIQLKIYDDCPEKETTIIMRRLMMKIAERFAETDGAMALITGEALGQVASQTLESLVVTNDAVTMPVFRPLIGFDKEEIMDVARRIGTFETSILPYEDCCTVFVPQHPVTKPKLTGVRESESKVDFSGMIEDAIANTETIDVMPEA